MKLRLPLKLAAAVIAAMTVACCISASGNNISVNFGSSSYYIQEGATSGAYITDGWINSSQISGMVDLGNGVQVEITAGGTYQSTTGIPGVNGTMMNGYLDDSATTQVKLDFSGLNMDMYDVYIYANTDNGNNKYAAKTVTTYDGDNQLSTGTYTGGNGTNQITTGTTQTWGINKAGGLFEGGNYLLVTGLTGDRLYIDGGTYVAGTSRTCISAVQIVAFNTLTADISAMVTSVDWTTSIWNYGGTVRNWIAGTDEVGSRASITASGSGSELNLGASPVVISELALKAGSLSFSTGGTLSFNNTKSIRVDSGASLYLDGTKTTLQGNPVVSNLSGNMYLSNLSTLNTFYISGGNLYLGTAASVTGGSFYMSGGNLFLGAGSSVTNSTLYVTSGIINFQVPGTAINNVSLSTNGGTLRLQGVDGGTGRLENNGLTVSNSTRLEIGTGSTLWVNEHSETNKTALLIGPATLVVDGGTVDTMRMVTSEIGASTVTLNSGLLNIRSASTGAAKEWEHALRMGHWNYQTTWNQTGGELRVLNGIVRTGDDGYAVWNISGGVTNANGIILASSRSSLNLSGTGRINLGTMGLVNAGGILNARGGTFGVLDEGWTMNAALTLNLSGTLTIDTQATYNRTANTFGAGVGKWIDIKSAITQIAGETAGKIIKTGDGLLTLGGINTFTGGVELRSGSLQTSSAGMGADGFRNLTIAPVGGQTVTVISSNGELVLDSLVMAVGSKLDFGTGENQTILTIKSLTSFGEGVSFLFQNGDKVNFDGGLSGTLTIEMSLAGYGEGDTIDLGTYRNTVGTVNFLNTNASSTDYRLTSANVLTAGNRLLASVSGGAANLVWTSSNSVWDLKTTGGWSGAADGQFYQGDKVSFMDISGSASQTVTMNGSLLPGSMTIDNAMTSYLFTGGTVTVGLSFDKTGSGLWTLGTGSRLIIGAGASFNMTSGSLLFDGGSLELTEATVTDNTLNLGILQKVGTGSSLLLGNKNLVIGIANAADASNLVLKGSTGYIQAIGTNAIHISDISGRQYAGTAGLVVTGTSSGNADNLGIYGGGRTAQTEASGLVTVGSKNASTITNITFNTSANSGIFGTSTNLGVALNAGVTVNETVLARTLAQGTVTGNILNADGTLNTGALYNTTITAKMYGGAYGSILYGSSTLTLDGVFFKGSSPDWISGGELILVAASNAAQYGNATLTINNSRIDSKIFGTVNNLKGDLTYTTSNSWFANDIVLSGPGGGAIVDGRISFTDTGSTFNGNFYGTRDGTARQGIALSLTGSTVNGNVSFGSTMVKNDTRIQGGVNLTLDNTKVVGVVSIISPVMAPSKADPTIFNGDATITISGNSNIKYLNPISRKFVSYTGNLTVNIQGGIIGDGMTSVMNNTAYGNYLSCLSVGAYDGKLTGDAFLNISGGEIRNEYIVFAGIGSNGIVGNVEMTVSGGKVMSNIYAAGDWAAHITGDSRIILKGGILGLEGANRILSGGSYGGADGAQVKGNSYIVLDGGDSGAGASFIGNSYTIYAGSATSTNVAGNTVVTLQNVDKTGGVANMSGVISGGNASGGGVNGTKSLVFDNYGTEANAQFKYFDSAEVKGNSSVTLKGNSSNITSWLVRSGSTISFDDFAKLGMGSGVANTLTLESNATATLTGDASLPTSMLQGTGRLNVTNATLTVNAISSFAGTLGAGSNGVISIENGGSLSTSSASLIAGVGGAIRVNGTNKTISQKLSGTGVLSINMDGGQTALFSSSSSDFSGDITVNSGILDLAAGSGINGVDLTVNAGGTLKVNDGNMNRFATVAGEGNILFSADINSMADGKLSGFTGSISVDPRKSLSITKASGASSNPLNDLVTLNMNSVESTISLINNTNVRWNQTIQDVLGAGNITLSGGQGVSLTITGTAWAMSSINFNLVAPEETPNLYSVYVGGDYGTDPLDNITITLNDSVYAATVREGYLVAFTDYTELSVTPDSLYDVKLLYIVTGVNGVDGTTTVDSSISDINIRSLKLTSSDTNLTLDLNQATMNLANGSLVFDGTNNYSLTNGTITSTTGTLTVRTGVMGLNLAIDSAIGSESAPEILTKEGAGELLMTGATHVSAIKVNDGILRLGGSASADNATATIASGKTLILGNSNASSYVSGLTSITNAGTLTLLEGASFGTSPLPLVNNGTTELYIGAGNTMDMPFELSGTGTVAIKSGSLAIDQSHIVLTQSYSVDSGALVSFNWTETGTSVATAISGSGTVVLNNSSNREPFTTDLSNFDGTLQLSAAASPYRVQISTLKDGATVIIGNNAQMWDRLAGKNYTLHFELSGMGQENRGALRINDGTPTYNGTILIVGSAGGGIGGAAVASVVINSNISSDIAQGNLLLGTDGSNGLGTVTLNGDNSALAGLTLYNVSKVIATTTHALGGKVLYQGTNGTRTLETQCMVETGFINGFSAGKLLILNGTTAGLNLTDDTTASVLAGDISGTGSMVFTGDALVTLAGNNSYSGGTLIGGGKVMLSGNSTALGTGKVDLLKGSLNLGGLAASNDMNAICGVSLAGMGAYAGTLTVSSGNGGLGGADLAVDGNLRVNSLKMADASARVKVNGDITIANGGSFVLGVDNVHDKDAPMHSIVTSTGSLTMQGVFTVDFDTNIKSGLNEFLIFGSSWYTSSNSAQVQLTYQDEYLKTFYTADTSRFNTEGILAIKRNTPSGLFMDQDEIDDMDSYIAEEWTALGAKASGTATNPVNFNKDYITPTSGQNAGDYLLSNGQGWINIQTGLTGTASKVLIYDYIPENGAPAVTNDRGVILSNNNNNFGGGLMSNGARLVIDGSFAGNAGNMPVAGGVVTIMGTGAVAIGGNSGILELRPLGAGDNSAFTIGNAISLRDGASIIQTGGTNTLTGDFSLVHGSGTISATNSRVLTLAGDVSSATDTTLNLSGNIAVTGKIGKGAVSLDKLVLAGGAVLELAQGAHGSVAQLSASQATLRLSSGSSLTLGSADQSIRTLSGSGKLTLSQSNLMLTGSNTLETTILGTGTVSLSENGQVSMVADRVFGSGIVLGLGSDGVLSLDGYSLDIGAVTGSGDIVMGNGTLAITGGSSTLDASLVGSGTIVQKSGNTLSIEGPGNDRVNLVAESGTIALSGGKARSVLSYDSADVMSGGGLVVRDSTTLSQLTVANGGSMTLGNISEKAAQLKVNYDASLANGSTVNCVIPSDGAQLVVSGSLALGESMSLNLMDNDSGEFTSPVESFVLFSAAQGFTHVDSETLWADGTKFTKWTMGMTGNLALFYSPSEAVIQGRELIVQLKVNENNALAEYAQSDIARAGADLLWFAGMQKKGSNLDILLASVMDAAKQGRLESASHKMAAAAGSTLTSILGAQKADFTYQQTQLRNRMTTMGLPAGYNYDDELPLWNTWIQGTGSYNSLSKSGDFAGFKYNTWGGTFGVDANVSERLTVGIAMSASYGKLTSEAADTLTGNLDVYYANLFARYQKGKWGHNFIVSAGWSEGTVERSVNFGDGSYIGQGITSGSTYGAMYEATYDIALHEETSAIFQPLLNVSVMRSEVSNFDETGAGNTGLRVTGLEGTMASVAVGGRLMGIVGGNVFGRESLGELRVQIAQDMGDSRSEGKVGFLANPAYNTTVKGAKAGTTGLQFGAGLSLPSGENGTIFVDATADIRSGMTSASGSLGYRYNF